MSIGEKIKKKAIIVSGYYLVKLLVFIVRVKVNLNNSERNLGKNTNNVIYAFWHSVMLVPGLYLKNRGIQVLISQHRDGEYVAGALKYAGYETIRGSSTRGGARALIQLAKKVINGHSVLITPDGPRGPRQIAQPGIIFLAKKSGRPIVPISVNVSRYWQLPSWDKFIIPKPFAKVTLSFENPIYIPPKINDQELDEYCTLLENALNKRGIMYDKK